MKKNIFNFCQIFCDVVINTQLYSRFNVLHSFFQCFSGFIFKCRLKVAGFPGLQLTFKEGINKY